MALLDDIQVEFGRTEDLLSRWAASARKTAHVVETGHAAIDQRTASLRAAHEGVVTKKAALASRGQEADESIRAADATTLVVADLTRVIGDTSALPEACAMLLQPAADERTQRAGFPPVPRLTQSLQARLDAASTLGQARAYLLALLSDEQLSWQATREYGSAAAEFNNLVNLQTRVTASMEAIARGAHQADNRIDACHWWFACGMTDNYSKTAQESNDAFNQAVSEYDDYLNNFSPVRQLQELPTLLAEVRTKCPSAGAVVVDESVRVRALQRLLDFAALRPQIMAYPRTLTRPLLDFAEGLYHNWRPLMMSELATFADPLQRIVAALGVSINALKTRMDIPQGDHALETLPLLKKAAAGFGERMRGVADKLLPVADKVAGDLTAYRQRLDLALEEIEAKGYTLNTDWVSSMFRPQITSLFQTQLERTCAELDHLEVEGNQLRNWLHEQFDQLLDRLEREVESVPRKVEDEARASLKRAINDLVGGALASAIMALVAGAGLSGAISDKAWALNTVDESLKIIVFLLDKVDPGGAS